MSLEHEDAVGEMREKKCVWKEVKEQTKIINEKPFYMIYHYPTCCSDGSTREYQLNYAFVKRIKYCPYCGREIEVSDACRT